MVRCLVNFAIGPAVKLNQDPHKSNLVCLKKSSKSGLSLHLSTAWDEVELFFVSQGIGKDNILDTSLQAFSQTLKTGRPNYKRLSEFSFMYFWLKPCLSCYSLSQPILRGAYIVTNPWGLFLRDSAIKF